MAANETNEVISAGSELAVRREKAAELLEMSADDCLLQPDDEERALRFVAGFAQCLVRRQIAETAVDDAGRHRHAERRLLLERHSVGRERLAWETDKRQRVADRHR